MKANYVRAVLLVGLLAWLGAGRAGAAVVTNNLPSLAAVRSNHVIVVDEFGRLCRPDGSHRRFTATNEISGYLDNIIQHITNRPPPVKVLIFIHGGLNTWNAGLAHFDDNYTAITNSGYYPVFVVWPSGLNASYLDHLWRVRQGQDVSLTYGILTSPLMIGEDLGRGITRAPMVWLNLVRDDYSTTYFIKSTRNNKRSDALVHLDDLVNGRTDRVGRVPAVDISIGYDYRTPMEKFGRSCTYVVSYPVKLLTSPLIDALGKSAWDNMLRRTENIYPAQFSTLPTTNLLNRRGAVPEAVRRSVPALPLFMHKLERAEAAHPDDITLLGHSAGTILIDRIVRNSPLNFSNIVYEGSATTIQHFQLYVSDYLNEHPQAKFYNLCLHPVAESREINAFDLPPRGSLLDWIDNFLSKPLNVNGRTLGKWDNLFEVNRQGHFQIDELIRGKAGHQMNFKAFNVGYGAEPRSDKFQWTDVQHGAPPPAWKDHPQKHAEFVDLPFWDPKFWDPAQR